MKGLFAWLLSWAFSFLSIPATLGQTLLAQGQVLEARTLTSVPFATISLVGTSLGTTADGQGKFELPLPSPLAPEAQLLISCLGYEPQRLAATAFSAGPQLVRLAVTTQTLQEVTIRPRLETTTTVGTRRSAKELTTDAYNAHNLISTAPAHEIAARLTMPQACTLQYFNFGVAFNTFRTIPVRLNLYRTRAGQPTPALPTYSVPVAVAQKRGWIQVDLRELNVELAAGEELVASLQWIRHDTVAVHRNSFVVASTPGRAQQYLTRNTAQEPWQQLQGTAPAFYLTAATSWQPAGARPRRQR
ncbi:carboxypeptidase-like regulatory domain-containing protein [Hymenobacter cellulosivorans]|uniref:Carboxypeptidase-like regulatory domain-containing protein n=1 Tax=Hymenobacter cellulosivorans TaxID=2932249 RepID=A0ABY4F5P5_9BACT|nr:carboxypeptidase-like regulatory domain-containing protein [Hymenobacter cellulosivorans]UOQ51998.1 carboxypeptidase-like regulatory domain-containing protein [Hymenobacter cellulosivorans]